MTMPPVDRTDRVCVIGAGSSGLTAAKNLAQAGFKIDVLEREDDIGGNWNYGKPNARVYRSTHTISSKRCTQYVDFPMPRHFPDYPHHTQILEYLRTYAQHFGLEALIEFNTPVERIEPADAGSCWDVTPANQPTRRYGALVIANGHNWSPKWPTYPGHFAGTMMHSAQYRTPDVLAGRRVLVIGAGNSGCDIAVESAQNAVRTLHSTRRGYHYIPKFVFGRPSDKLGDKLLKARLPLRLRRWLTTTVLRWLVGSPEKFGLPRPDHKLFETHPIINSLLLYYVGHGDIIPKPDIARFDEHTVHFTDGSREKIDVIVCATGYNIVFPFIDTKYLNWRDGKPCLYKNVFHPDSDSLFVLGLIQPDSGQFGLVDWQARCVAGFLGAVRAGSPSAQVLRATKKSWDEDLGNGIHFKDSTRHLLEVEHWSYRAGLMQLAATLTSSHHERRAA
jgi:cation diffusion facilitator CzcD-associated flavoprotein CzcO